MPRAWADPLVQPKQWQRCMRFGTWSVRSLCRSGSLTTVARELALYKLDSGGVQEVRSDKRGRVRAGDCIFFSVKKETKIINWEQEFLYNTESYQQLREEILLAIGCHSFERSLVS